MSDLENQDEIVKEFLVESQENLDRLDRELLVLEKDPSERKVLASIFRTIHTIKGTAGFLGFSRLESLTHAGENLLGLLRDGEMMFDLEIATALLGMVDAIRQMLANIEKSNGEGEGDYSRLSAELTRLYNRQQKGTPAKAAAPAPATVTAPAPAPKPVAAAAPAPAPPPPAPPPAPPKAAPAAEIPADGSGQAGSVTDNTIRVDVRLLDRLMNLVGELVLARNQILQFTSSKEDAENAAFTATCQRLNLITSELQEGVMKTRMQPIGNVWSRFPRVVRDLAISCGKQVAVEMEGAETELDKTIIEAIKDPLTHLVRNSVDHGLEAPDVRATRGKNREGRLILRAYHEGGKVNIEIRDDGGGIDVDKVKARAVQRGLLAAEEAERMNDREASQLIFLPGFSTADKITNVSGRGVGMDVVKTNIEKIGGTVDISSVKGEGTAVMIKIPLTLAIVPALIITSGGARYAIPQVSLLELVRLEPEQRRTAIELIHGTPVYRLRGNLLPLVSLARELGDEPAHGPLAPENEPVNIVVLQADDRQFGLVVSAINDTEEIVVKPLAKQLKGSAAFAGATIMGDGKVALILDVLGIAQRARVVSEVRERALHAKNEVVVSQEDGDKQTFLLCSAGGGSRIAIPLGKVSRLEEFQEKDLEELGDQTVIQYRGRILPLLPLADVLPERRRTPREAAAEGSSSLRVVVHSNARGSVGLVVDQILDIVEDSLVLQRPASRPGVLGSAVLQGRVTELLDMDGVIRQLDPVMAAAASAEAQLGAALDVMQVEAA